MASIVLGTVGKVIGSQAGPVGAFLGNRIGQYLGGLADSRLVGGSGKTTRHSEGARLEDLAVQSSTYGRVIPRLYGTVRIAGNVIWSRPIKELATTTTTTSRSSGGKGGGGRRSSAQTTTETTYSYTASLAIVLCEGQITRINRMWADAKLLSIGQLKMRVYRGTETQLPDALIESYVGSTTAYRGLAYVVIEDFPLADYGNRIPNFTFEVTRKMIDTAAGTPAEHRVKALTLIPGSGECVYDTAVQSKVVGEDVGGQWVQRGNQVTLNMHNISNRANVKLALDHMMETFPNLEWVSVVVNWFGNSMNAGSCIVEPCVEFADNVRITPNEWGVAGKVRGTARVISYDGGSPRYGGTPSDTGVVRLLDDLRARGLKIFFYPMMLMDVVDKPWRGNLTGSSTDVNSFFTKTNGYNAFVMHYANLVVGKVDAFAIGSEMKGLTKVASSAGVYPAVTQFVSLAASVKTTLGSGVKVTYAADWSEYHHTDGGWYNLDPLWASSHIDVIGIDAYFPLTDAPQSDISKQAIMDGWTSGEGYSWYYTNPARTTTAALSAPYAWKNIAWWWSNTHVNPNGATTAWMPSSKKIWFTEYGFASVDGTSNEPNRFVDATSVDGGYPRFSKGTVDFAAQRTAIEATEEKWLGSGMVERMFLWTWDARPYPQWPDLTSIWSDGRNWSTGHWVQGKLGHSNLAAILRDIVNASGIDNSQLDCSALTQLVEGYVINERKTARAALEELALVYPFDVVESAGKLKAVLRGRASVASIDASECLPSNDNDSRIVVEATRTQELELTKEVEVLYLNRLDGYNTAAARAVWQTASSRIQTALRLSLVLSAQLAKWVAEQQLRSHWLSRTRFQFQLPIRYATLEPGDVISLSDSGLNHVMRIEHTQFGKPGMVRIEAVAEDAQLYESPVFLAEAEPVQPVHSNEAAATILEILDIPLLPGEPLQQGRIHFAATGAAQGWPGCSVYHIKSDGDDLLATMDAPAIMGVASSVLAYGAPHRFDYVSHVEVVLLGDAMLANATEEEVLNGANAALLGEEIIQFTTATPLAAGKYRLSGLLRGRLGTEYATASHVLRERFVLLDGALASHSMDFSMRGRPMELAAVTFGNVIDPEATISVTPSLRGLMPYAPVYVTASRVTNDITLRWIRRTRQQGGLQDYQDIPLGEADERYDVEIMNGSMVLRTVRTAAPVLLYTSAQQITDFGSVQASVEVRVYQISAAVGRGMAANATV